MERSKDTLIKVRTTIRGKDNKGRDRYQFYFDKEVVAELIGILSANANSEKGVKLDLHVDKKTSEQGRQFDSTFGFLKAVEGEGAATGAQPAGRYVPVKTAVDTQAALKASQIKG